MAGIKACSLVSIALTVGKSNEGLKEGLSKWRV